MASLCTPCPSLPAVDLPSDAPDHLLLFKLWKNAHSSQPSVSGEPTRAANRHWRLLNERFFCERVRLKFAMALPEAPLPHRSKDSHKAPTIYASEAPSRPSLFLKEPKNYSDSGDDTSDMSEDDDYHNYHGLSLLHTNSDHSRSESCRRQRLPRPSGPCSSRYLELTLLQLDQLAPKVTPPDPKKNIFFIENTPSPARSSSDSRTLAFPSGGTGHTLATTHEISSSLQANTSSPKVEGQPEETKADLAPPLSQLKAPFQRQDSLFSAQNLRRASPDDVSSVSSSELSEDEERDDLHELRVRQPSTVSKLSRSMKSDNESEWISISSEDEKNLQGLPTKPLTFAKVTPMPVPGARSSPGDAADLSTETVKPSPLAKPRSLLSGLFLNSMAEKPTSLNEESLAAPKPVLKRSSTTGVITIDKANASASSNTKDKKQLLRPSIMFSKRYASYSDISKLSQRSPVLFVEEEDSATDANAKDSSGALFAKQTSSVGLLNFMVNANSTTNLSSLSISEASAPKSCENCECTISSSLSKYSNVHPHGSSLKNFLSKSSLSLTSLFGQSKHDRRLRPGGHRTVSNDSLKALKDSVSDKSATSGTSAPLPEESEEPPMLSKSVKTLSIPTKTFEPSVEVSGSLKDSLLIDHRLGKVPLPERVISEEDLFGGQERLMFEDDNDDYHSKGW